MGDLTSTGDIAVLFGGASSERFVSVASAQHLAECLPQAELWYWSPKNDVFVVSHAQLLGHKNPFTEEFTPQGKKIAAGMPELAAHAQRSKHFIFIAFHGGLGEDGQLQAELTKAGVSYQGSGAEASALCMDKIRAKAAMRSAGAHVADEIMIDPQHIDHSSLKNFLSKHQDIVLKPTSEGSSFGVFFVNTPAELAQVAAKISAGHATYMAEPRLKGREFTTGVFEQNGKLRPLPASEVVLADGFRFDYQGKYLGKGTTEITPAELTPTQMQQAQNLALLAHRSLGCRGYTRTDMFLVGEQFFFVETNTLPGLTKASFIPQQLQAAGISMQEFLAALVTLN